jgi:dolichol-phosphate mannosyltransferase
MAERRWELIFVDDDSKDGTAAAAVAMGREGYPVRCLRRIGRRGLSSAVVEGALAATYDVIGVMDADFQHDEAILPQMLDAIAECDLVIGSRHVEGGGLGEWDKSRVQLSDFATRLSRILIGDRVTDPMSGFFMIRRDVFEASVYDLSQQGYKILLDILSSSPRKLRIKELPYVFRSRREGESKLDILILAEFVFLIGEKLSGGLIPPRFILFAAVGGLGLVINLLTLGAMGGIGFHFLKAQAVAILVSMAFNYVVNNMITYRDQRLKGTRFVVGFAVFCIVCSIGAVANIGVAELAINKTGNWPLSGVAGALMGAVFNFGVATKLVWGSRRLRGGAFKGRRETVYQETIAAEGAPGA